KLTTWVMLGPLFLMPTPESGPTQDLIMWNQLPDAARTALNTADFGAAHVPFNDANFEQKLKESFILQ
ncbi:Necrosis inducing protein NPP1, partial [Phytophthora megakarya]